MDINKAVYIGTMINIPQEPNDVNYGAVTVFTFPKSFLEG